MGILLGFAPFIVFVLVTSVSVSLGIWLAFSAAFVIAIRDFVQSPTLRLLDAGSVVLFGLLAFYTGFIQPGLSIQAVRFLAEGGFMTVALASLLLRRPVTLEYAHEQMAEDAWKTPRFIRANYILTAVWALAFSLMTAADTATVLNPNISPSLDIAGGFAVLGFAIAFSVRYPAGILAREKHAARGG